MTGMRHRSAIPLTNSHDPPIFCVDGRKVFSQTTPVVRISDFVETIYETTHVTTLSNNHHLVARASNGPGMS